MRVTSRLKVVVRCPIGRCSSSGGAHAQADFFKGKTINVVVGARAVGSLSVSAQILTRHWGRYIPGNPHGRPPPDAGRRPPQRHERRLQRRRADGLTILAANPQVAMAQLFKMPAVTLRCRGSSSGSVRRAPTPHCSRSAPNLPYKIFKDLQNARKELADRHHPLVCDAQDVPLLLKEFAGAKFRLVSGYAANTDIKLALERREVDGWTALGHHRAAGGRAGICPADGAVQRTSIPELDHIPVDEDLANMKR